jgi:lysophospholipase L1-like esterase
VIKRYWFHVLAILLLVVSVGLNVVLYRFAEDRYREVHGLRLDPTSERRFSSLNANLAPPATGDSRIVFFGDSRIADWERLPEVSKAQLVNRGRGGETTEQLLLRLERDVIALQPDVVVLQAGVNDLVSIGVFPHRSAEIIENCQRNLEQIVSRIEKADIPVVVMTILPVGRVPLKRQPVWSEQTRDAVEQINDRLRERSPSGAAGTDSVVLDCDAAVADASRTKPSYELDTLHLNPSGYKALNALLEPVLASLVQAGGSAQ